MSSDGMSAGTAGRHDSDTDLGHGRTRHGQAHLPGHSVPAHGGERRRCHRRRVRLPRQQDPCAQRKARVRRHHDGPDLVRRACRRARGRRRQAGDSGADSRDGRRSPPPRGRHLPRARRQGRGTARRCRRLGSWPRGFPVRGRQRWRAVHPHEERRDDQEGRGCEGHVTHRRHADGLGSRAPARTSRIRNPPSSQIPWRPRRSRSPPGRRRTTRTAPPVTATWRRVR